MSLVTTYKKNVILRTDVLEVQMILKKKDYFATRYSLIPDLQLDFASIQGITKEKKFMNWLLSFEKEKKKEVFYRAKNYTLYCKQVSINCFFMSFAKELQETIGQKTDDGIQDTLINNYKKCIIADYSTIKGVESKHPEIKKPTFREVYEQFLKWKFAEGTNYSESTRNNYTAAYTYCTELYDKIFEDLKATELQNFLDKQKGLKKGSLVKILSLFNQMYKYAMFAEIVTERKSQYVRINAVDDEEHGTPFTEHELRILWKNANNPDIQLILIMSYSGWRIGELSGLEVNLKEKYFKGGIKTQAGKGRIVPIHPMIYDFVKTRITADGTLLNMNKVTYRMFRFYPILEKLEISGSPKHTPHDCRHTFSALCEKYSVRENDRKRMLGHSFGSDITNAVYGHRTLEELRSEIEKIKVPFVTNCD